LDVRSYALLLVQVYHRFQLRLALSAARVRCLADGVFLFSAVVSPSAPRSPDAGL